MSTTCDQCGESNPADIHTCGAGVQAAMAHIVGEIDHAGKVWTPAQPAPVALTDEQITDKNRLDWLSNNFFNRENVDWLTGNVSKESLMWVFFAPTKVQGDIRRVIDAAMDRDNGITKGQP